jgi:hypothetical protein
MCFIYTFYHKDRCRASRNGDLNNNGIFKKTAGFTLNNFSDSETKNHEVVEADVFFKSTLWEKSYLDVQNWVSQNGKVDILIERMVGPLFLIRDPNLLYLLLDRWILLLNNFGTAFIQLPQKLTDADCITAINKLKTKYNINTSVSYSGINRTLLLERID